MRKVLLIDNYDSFTFNLVHLCHEAASILVDVRKNDELLLSDVDDYIGIIISPGPDLPQEAGMTLDIIQAFYKSKPIFGICLGHQAIGQSFGARLSHLPKVYHGQQTNLCQEVNSGLLFNGIPHCFPAGRYHSWVIDNHVFPSETFNITCRDLDNNIMSIQHKSFPLFGVQFHPESIMTPHGLQMMKNFFSIL